MPKARPKAAATAASIRPHARPPKPPRKPAARVVGRAAAARDATAPDDSGCEIESASTDGEPMVPALPGTAASPGVEPDTPPASTEGDANAGDASTATAAPPKDSETLACGPRASCCRLAVACCSDPVVSFWPRAVAAASRAF